MNHTPGSWTVFYDEIGIKDERGYQVKGIVKIKGVRYGRLNGEQEANAHLIAAAPDLLEACKFALDMFDKCALYTMEGELYPTGMMKKTLRQAIAKAEGR